MKPASGAGWLNRRLIEGCSLFNLQLLQFLLLRRHVSNDPLVDALLALQRPHQPVVIAGYGSVAAQQSKVRDSRWATAACSVAPGLELTSPRP